MRRSILVIAGVLRVSPLLGELVLAQAPAAPAAPRSGPRDPAPGTKRSVCQQANYAAELIVGSFKPWTGQRRSFPDLRKPHVAATLRA